jgi:DNA polymerase III alpha subunit
MNDSKKEIFETRQMIADNLDALLKYGQKHQKTALSGQMSLFDSIDEVKIEPIRLEKRSLSDYELNMLAKKEGELIGVPLTHDPYIEYFLIEKALCTSTLREVILAPENNDFKTILCEITKTERRTSKAGRGYYKVYMSRDGLESYAFLFGDDIDNNFKKISPGKIHIVRTMSSGNMLTIKKIEQSDNIDVSKYVGKILIEIPDNPINLTRIRNYIHFSMKDDDGINMYFKYGGEVLNGPVFKVKINNSDCEELVDLGCKIFVKKI